MKYFRIHRNSDYGAYHADSKTDNGLKPAAYNYDVRGGRGSSFPLRRTASEESVQKTGHDLGLHHKSNMNRQKRPAAHRKGKAPNPPLLRGKTSPNIVRSNSVNQVKVILKNTMRCTKIIE